MATKLEGEEATSKNPFFIASSFTHLPFCLFVCLSLTRVFYLLNNCLHFIDTIIDINMLQFFNIKKKGPCYSNSMV